MRVAISGTHRSGKSTLLGDLVEVLPGYAAVEEAYESLAEEGYEFADPPSLEDFEAQLLRSVESLQIDQPDVLFDRCPADFLGYLLTHPDAEALEFDAWLPRVRAALQTLDFIVFVPVEPRDRIRIAASEDAEFRTTVDEKLREVLLQDPFELGTEVLEVEGSRQARVRQVLERLRGPG